MTSRRNYIEFELDLTKNISLKTIIEEFQMILDEHPEYDDIELVLDPDSCFLPEIFLEGIKKNKKNLKKRKYGQ